MMTGTPRTTPGKNEFVFYLVWISVHLSVSELAQAKYVMPAFNSKWKYEKLAAVVHVLLKTQNLVTLFSTGRLRQVQRLFLAHVHSYCSAH